MSKLIIVCETGKRVYRTLEELSYETGVAPASISRLLSEGKELNGRRIRWASRVFAIRRKGQTTWEVAGLNSRNSAYVICGDVTKKVNVRDVEERKDITAAWYYSREEW